MAAGELLVLLPVLLLVLLLVKFTGSWFAFWLVLKCTVEVWRLRVSCWCYCWLNSEGVVLHSKVHAN